jgi:protein-S-isoprenylcysteine O-methyltransferase Ste14
MLYFVLKCAISGVLVAAASTLARRYPGFGALIASLPLVSVLGMMWLWRDKPDAANMAAHAQATFWYVLPSLPMFLLIPALLRRGVNFWMALSAGCLLTILLYLLMTWAAPKLGLRL